MPANKRALIIFVKNPELGKVKTRLARDAGDEKALEVYQWLMQHTRDITSAVDCDRRLHYSSWIPEQDDWSLSFYDKLLQSDGDLGQRMEKAFEQAFAAGYVQVVIIGSDCADLTTEMIRQSFEALSANDFVLGPAKDGGYYLLGMKALERSLFRNKAWSTEDLFEQTKAAFERLNAKCHLMPMLSDIDYYDDYLDFMDRQKEK